MISWARNAFNSPPTRLIILSLNVGDASMTSQPHGSTSALNSIASAQVRWLTTGARWPTEWPWDYAADVSDRIRCGTTKQL